jgi:hypothetical protein
MIVRIRFLHLLSSAVHKLHRNSTHNFAINICGGGGGEPKLLYFIVFFRDSREGVTVVMIYIYSLCISFL